MAPGYIHEASQTHPLNIPRTPRPSDVRCFANLLWDEKNQKSTYILFLDR
jgi:hypothetical protein